MFLLASLMTLRHFFSPLPLLLLALLLSACESPPPDPTVRLAGSTMGTSYEIKLVPAPGQIVPADLKQQVDAVLAARGWQRGTHFTSLQFDGGDHNEAAWRSRVRVPLQTLLSA